jgi:uncharacterized protein YkwD
MAKQDRRQVTPRLEQLEERELLAGSITFNPALGVVTVTGTPRGDRLAVSYAAGAVQVRLSGPARALALFPRTQVVELDFFGNGGHDVVSNRTSVVLFSFPPGRGLAPWGDATNLLTPDELLIFQQMNAARAGQGLAPLRINPLLQQAAQNHANNMAQLDRYGDSGTDGHILNGHDVVWRVDQTGYRWSVLGENVAYNWGFPAPAQELFNQWWSSPEHQANLLSPLFQEVGIGVAVSASGKTYGVQDFGHPA